MEKRKLGRLVLTIPEAHASRTSKRSFGLGASAYGACGGAAYGGGTYGGAAYGGGAYGGAAYGGGAYGGAAWACEE